VQGISNMPIQTPQEGQNVEEVRKLVEDPFEARSLEIESKEVSSQILPGGEAKSNLDVKLVSLIENDRPGDQEFDLTTTLTKEKAQAILDSIWVKIPESERAQKKQDLRELLKKWRKEDEEDTDDQ